MEATNAAKAQAEAQKIEFDMQREMAENQTAIEEMRLKQKQREAETEAAAVQAMATANYERGVKEQEVLSRMPAQELELKRLELIVEGMKHFGQAAWRHPEQMQSFMNHLKPYLRLGPMTGNDFHSLAKNADMEQLYLPGTPSTSAE